MTIEDYTLRIAQATPVQLVIINHELLTAFIEDALKAFTDGDIELFYKSINKSKDALDQLICGLDMENPIAQSLYNLYRYANELLNKSLYSKDTQAAEEVKTMFEELLEAWQAIENTPDERLAHDPSTAGPKVYAGLTYGKGGDLAEYIPENEGREFKA